VRQCCEYNDKFAPRSDGSDPCREPAVDYVDLATSSSEMPPPPLVRMWLCAKHWDGWEDMRRVVRELYEERGWKVED
jgi:hypothetical protein